MSQNWFEAGVKRLGQEKRPLQFVLVFALAVLLVTSSAVPNVAQTKNQKSLTPSERVKIEQEIKNLAAKDVQDDISQRTDKVINWYKNSGLPLQEIRQIYDDEYTKQDKSKRKDFREFLNPKNGWLIPSLTAILGAIGATLITKFSTSFLNWLHKIDNWIYQRFSGNKFFWTQALRRYRKALVEKHGELKIPFRPNRPLDMAEIYVPLKVAGTRNREAKIEALQAVRQYKRLMVTGEPGSGKTMLLRYLALNYGLERLQLANNPVVVLLELHRLAGGAEILPQLVEALKRGDFPNGEAFLKQALQSGKLVLLLDGLDEVSSNDRTRVVRHLRDFLDVYGKCGTVITCRTPVYQGEFDLITEQTLEVEAFTDAQIQQFLRPWQRQTPAEKSVQQLVQALNSRPQVKALARNPLLLTIIAYLYCDTSFVLPHSRAEFYAKSTDILLETWDQSKENPNQFKGFAKRLVLQHLALYAQDSIQSQLTERRRTDQQQERKTLNFQTIAQEIQTILPALNLDAEQDWQLVLDEIVERSGLLLRIDGGARYQFSSLTLQEFFAASALINKPQQIIQRYQAAPDDWYEAIKVWCGLSNDATEVIASIYKIKPILALECIPEAQQVNKNTADSIIKHFKSELATENASWQFLKAFAALVSDFRPRGQYLFEYLVQLLDDLEKPLERESAIKILSLTYRHDAAQALASVYDGSDSISASLIRMGDIAIPALVNLVKAKEVGAFTDLRNIDTPAAIDAAGELTFFVKDTIKEIESYSYEIDKRFIKIEVIKGGFFKEKDSELILQVKNLSNQKLEGIKIVLDESPEYQITSFSNIRNERISFIKANSNYILKYRLKTQVIGQLTLQLRLENEFYQPPLTILSVSKNPYICGNPIEDKANFYGRKNELESIRNHICDENGSPTMLIGEQRSGKTSIFRLLTQELPKKYIPIYISLSGVELETKKALKWILIKIQRELKQHKISTDIIPDLEFNNDFCDELTKIEHQVKSQSSQTKIALIIDEMHEAANIGNKFQEVLREAFISHRDFIRITVACYHSFFSDAKSSSSPLHNIFKYIHLKMLEGDDLDALITKPAKMFGYTYTKEAVAAIKHISGGHPYYCQAICHESLDIARNQRKKEISYEFVKEAKKITLKNDIEKFRLGYWLACNLDEKYVLKKIIQGQRISEKKESRKTLESLERKLILTKSHERLVFSSLLFREWVEQLLEYKN
ncbi:AAA family ATPase [filamentous cyanobacterium LEGE 11480]|uniref:AAA family ATPase n=1 Tax=Romeriopsis navalis LEGE 11480 TaxID=2777977 RepID=A0A928VT42_9CYAN|nr:AAA family ATPase [Romeriopsis navalis]MBE9031754.1 AAA family ATPase [Romeriopsis navalis LEGE 11480]